jgi:hypothetical protein
MRNASEWRWMRWGQQHQRWEFRRDVKSDFLGRGQRSPMFLLFGSICTRSHHITHAMSAAHRSTAYSLQPKPFSTYHYTTCGTADFRLSGVETVGHFDDITMLTPEIGARLERRIGKLEL